MLHQVSGAGQKLAVDKVTVLPASNGEAGGGFAKAAISASEQIKAATGVDIAAVAKRLEAGAKG